MMDFKKLNLRESRLKREAQHSPAAWSVVVDCGHKLVLSDAAVHNPVERKRYGDDLFYCDKCANGDGSGTGDHGFCVKTVNHKILSATPSFSSYSKQQEQEQHQHE
jgi:hypothetical protein